MPEQGSRKHFLDWTKKSKAEFSKELSEILYPTKATVTENDLWMPNENPKEAKIGEICSNFLTQDLQEKIVNWWLVKKRGANVPNWDLLSTCTINGKQGLILVEGKAHEGELGLEGKGFIDGISSKENHERIRQCITEARNALSKQMDGVNINVETHYQLCNRVAFAWKLASAGIPVVLMYLGFIGDTFFPKDYLRDSEHWQRAMEGYLRGVLPQSFFEVNIDCGKAPMTMIIRSRNILEIST